MLEASNIQMRLQSCDAQARVSAEALGCLRHAWGGWREVVMEAPVQTCKPTMMSLMASPVLFEAVSWFGPELQPCFISFPEPAQQQ